MKAIGPVAEATGPIRDTPTPDARVWLGVIADDVTGATDVAGHLVREGVATLQLFGVPAASDVVPADVTCVVIALKTRSIDAQESVRQSLAAQSWLAAHGVGHLYFKYCSTFDSTPAGNIGPVLDALASVSGSTIVVVAPSAPDNGRTVYQGKLFVGGDLLEESALKDHPLNPMRDSDLRRLLSPQTALEVGLVDWQTVASGVEEVRARLALLATCGTDVAIVDALTDSDLDTLAAAVLTAGHPLSSGSAGLAAALARSRSGAVTREPEPVVPRGPAIVLSGSSSEATRGQVEHYRRRHPSLLIDPLTLSRDGGALADVLRFVAAHREEAPLIHATTDRREIELTQSVLGVDHAASVIEDALGETARFARGLGIRAFVVAGGETSGAVANALGVTAVRVGEEVAPGVPWCLTVDDDPLSLLLKSGNFGGPRFFDEALSKMTERR